MLLRKNVKFLILLLSLGTLMIPATAHQVKISQDVGATLHIEPNDTPRSGKPLLAWFALTQKGGKVIPLENCRCQLSLYSQPYSPESKAIAQPTLKAVSAENYQGIPGAEITFPRAGGYEMILKGSPQNGASFQPFELRFPVTVAK